MYDLFNFRSSRINLVSCRLPAVQHVSADLPGLKRLCKLWLRLVAFVLFPQGSVAGACCFDGNAHELVFAPVLQVRGHGMSFFLCLEMWKDMEQNAKNFGFENGKITQLGSASNSVAVCVSLRARFEWPTRFAF